MRLALTRERGRKSGEAFAELPGREAERAVRALDRRSLGSRYIEVFVSSASEAGEAVAVGILDHAVAAGVDCFRGGARAGQWPSPSVAECARANGENFKACRVMLSRGKLLLED